ncbi:MAG: hypothetical protein COZ70_12725 [Deltaproteobacteria bacterium CG_4_8_14_3_um_filter_51_11]|nr:DUF2764 family protein [bacterium]OIP38921.1 MAG: hypothetical protein AUK25_11615 [Desulfobacteraceae bacterium CG2_30_51_40]PIP45486.1 MAG: hypothetical protein COX16_12900 [Deltaproteobacteria bacterium CG23_combo_of_CG06-09_8_20_14_all_51_20]PIX18717.1 MAG: hypothetical protein COZ70_12725 [Deltaproteobacteria bacterium CG_4_8_14_3_um_filter_51_11]PIY26619.1 MAG: hypothetical protein COZ11_02145 [Deltaproteobacteria bacterium CG_4_10_14_3_um_filter_51_14]PJB37138.1 MAG: hypothetical pro
MKYYFLVSYLPEILRDDKKLKVRLSDLLSEKYLFTEKDFAEIELLLLAGDLLQIERLLSGKEVDVEYCLYGKEFWREQLKSPKEVPEFMREAFEVFLSEGLTPRNLEQLFEAYYSYAIEKTSSTLMRNFLSFERDLRNVIAAVRAKRKGLPPSDYTVGENDLVDLLNRSTADDFGLSSEYPWIEKLIAALEPGDTEDAIQAIVWETLDEITEHLDFDFDVVLAYLLKLQIVERNLAMSEERGMDIVRQMEEL